MQDKVRGKATSLIIMLQDRSKTYMNIPVKEILQLARAQEQLKRAKAETQIELARCSKLEARLKALGAQFCDITGEELALTSATTQSPAPIPKKSLPKSYSESALFKNNNSTIHQVKSFPFTPKKGQGLR